MHLFLFLLQLVSTSPISFIPKPQLNWHYASLLSASNLITVILAIHSIGQSNIIKELANLGVSLTIVDMNESYAMQSKLRNNSLLYGEGEHNLVYDTRSVFSIKTE